MDTDDLFTMQRPRWLSPPASLRHYRLVRILIACVVAVGLLHILQTTVPRVSHLQAPDPVPYKPVPLPGYVNTGQVDRYECDELVFEGLLGVHQSFYLQDDLFEIAESLHAHPMVDYTGQEEGLSPQELIKRTWLRLAQSSVWVEKLKLHLTVTRVEFYTQGVKHWPKISFLRGQLYDTNWNELRNHTVHWNDEELLFPRIFDIPIPYTPGDGFFGPEDPRVIIEEGVDDAEPVIIFNMVSDLATKTRAMHIYRPFTGASTILTVEEDHFHRPGVEKNWAPFFYNPHAHSPADHKRYPSHILHFIYDFRPFRVLRCDLLNGWCKRIFDFHPPDNARHGNHPGRISGGTNFVPLHLDRPSADAPTSFIGFPRTHMSAGCQDALYRPELMILTATVDGSFYIDYLSGAIDFLDAVLWPSARKDPCGEGRILIANSVAHWDREADVMELSLTVDDSTTQMVRIKGVREHVESLPLWSLERSDAEAWSTIGQDVVGCSVQAAQVYAEVVAAEVNGTDLRKVREEAEKKEKERIEEERKAREEAEKKEKERLEEEKKRLEELTREESDKDVDHRRQMAEAERVEDEVEDEAHQ